MSLSKPVIFEIALQLNIPKSCYMYWDVYGSYNSISGGISTYQLSCTGAYEKELEIYYTYKQRRINLFGYRSKIARRMECL